MVIFHIFSGRDLTSIVVNIFSGGNMVVFHIVADPGLEPYWVVWSFFIYSAADRGLELYWGKHGRFSYIQRRIRDLNSVGGNVVVFHIFSGRSGIRTLLGWKANELTGSVTTVSFEVDAPAEEDRSLFFDRLIEASLSVTSETVSKKSETSTSLPELPKAPKVTSGPNISELKAKVEAEQHGLRFYECYLLCSVLYDERFSAFHYPVSDEDAPNYRSVIQNPMDMATLLQRVDSGHYIKSSDFQRDVDLILSNAKIYNGARIVSRPHELRDAVYGMLSQMDPALVAFCDKIAAQGGPSRMPDGYGSSALTQTPVVHTLSLTRASATELRGCHGFFSKRFLSSFSASSGSHSIPASPASPASGGDASGGDDSSQLVSDVMDLLRKAIVKKKSVYIPEDLRAPTLGAGEYATINCDGRRLGVGTLYQIGIIGRNRLGQVLFFYSLVINVAHLFHKSLNYKVTSNVDATISELCGLGASTLIAIEHKLSGCDIFTDSRVAFGMLATNEDGNFGKDTHWFLAMITKVLWLNNQEVFQWIGPVERDDNHPADCLSKMGKVKHFDLCTHCRREMIGFEARVEGWFEKFEKKRKAGKKYYKVIEGASYAADVARFKNLVLQLL